MGGTLLAFGDDKAILADIRNGSQESSHVNHGNGLQSDAGEESALATNDIDEEQGADDGGTELDETKDGSDEELLVGALDAQELKQLSCVDGDGTGARPLTEELDHGDHVDTVQVALVEEHLLDLAPEADSAGSLKLLVESSLDHGYLANNVLAIGGLLAETSQDLRGLLRLALLDEETGRLVLEEHEDEDDSSHHDVQAGGNQPLVVALLGNVNRRAIVGKVRQHNTDIHGTSEETGAETTDRRWRNLCDIHRTDDGRLADSQTSDETTSIYGTEVSTGTADHKNNNSNNPQGAEDTGSVNTTDAIANQEGTKFGNTPKG